MSTNKHGVATLMDMLDEHARHCPDAVAVTHGDQQLTFHELKVRSTALALELMQRPSSSTIDDRIIGVLLEHSIDLVVAVWGVLRSGAAYLPLEPEYPEDRLAYMVADSGASVVLTSPGLSDNLRDALPHNIQIRGLAGAADLPEHARDLPEPRPQDLAYVIYTSGSTGRPKGVAISHEAITHQIRWLQAQDHLGARTTILHKTPISFDAAQWELLANATGARIVLGKSGLYRDPGALIDAMRDNDVTTLQAVPTLLRALVETERLDTVPSLRRVYSGGEALSAVLARDLLAALPGIALTNLYGPSECTINATSHTLTPSDIPLSGPTVPIGVPVDGCEVLVVGPHLEPLPVDQEGELLIAGPQLARDYLHRPDLTQEKFVPVPAAGGKRYYRTGDIVRRDSEGVMYFVGRRDSQVKLHGHRIELDEVSHRIEEHPWVRKAATLVTEDARTGRDVLVACIEMDPKQAALMDQGNHGSHHQSKASRVQVRAQLSNPGVRTDDELRDLPVLPLLHQAGTQHQRRTAFSRKTYRNYNGGAVTRDNILGALVEPQRPHYRRELSDLTYEGLSELLRWFGQFHSQERLLPKLAYASPGALYATQLFVTVRNTADVAAGTYYYHPINHQLHLVEGVDPGHADSGDPPGLTFHFLGRQEAIETVYKNNVREVLEIEVGHMLGTLEEALIDQGLSLRPLGFEQSTAASLQPGVSDTYLGSFEAVPQGEGHFPDIVTYYVQAHAEGVAELPSGLYRLEDGDLTRLGPDLIEPRHVIAINQEAYNRSRFGISIVTRSPGQWLEYVALGRALQRVQSNKHGLGLMASGYSSKTGHPLPASLRLDALLRDAGETPGASYFAVGGKVSQSQIGSDGMDEDEVHMRGPAEMIKDDLRRALPYYMVPATTLVLDRLPLSPNGKIDLRSLADTVQLKQATSGRQIVEPHNDTERRLAGLWSRFLGYEDVSAEDDFFAMGGDSLTAVSLVNRINHDRDAGLKVQTLFRYPRLRDLAAQVDATGHDDSRLIVLNRCTTGRAAFCWPGLGGSPMNLTGLGKSMSARPVFGVQAWGINAGEEPIASIGSMARADIDQIQRVQPQGPYTLMGYSFGARVAFEAAWQLEKAGHVVDNLLLICPGNPQVEGDGPSEGRSASYDDAKYVRILFSVFASTVRGHQVEQCLREVHDEETFVVFMAATMPGLEGDVIRRIVRIVERTFQFEYTFEELSGRQLNARVSVLKATGDDYSFLDATPEYSAAAPTVLTLEGDHYSLLGEDIDELAEAVRAQLVEPLGEALSTDELRHLAAARTSAVCEARSVPRPAPHPGPPRSEREYQPTHRPQS
ncbi:amino acid adenylation domain-containing protein [Nocardioides sp. InS609-2]|uniref:amino acid adenylation domain-containing protein n=1 Tax=Nocardioides sp. InS609-2 TaxID=2760705 RepID=UPI0020BFABD9|nr:amino acid adenylation domain-containing protein [Nocardioides sp. InS609-2]